MLYFKKEGNAVFQKKGNFNSEKEIQPFNSHMYKKLVLTLSVGKDPGREEG